MKERRITLRFSPETFELIEDKRFKDKTTFQDVGSRLMSGWLKGEGSEPLSPFGRLSKEENEVLLGVLRYWRHYRDRADGALIPSLDRLRKMSYPED